MSAHAELRAATRAAHDEVDAAFSRFDLTDRLSYRRFLTAQAAAFLPAEQALAAQGAADLFTDWEQSRRGDLLRADLAELGAALPAPVVPPTLESPAAIAGAAYVLEGSRLGGAMLRRSVPADFPTRFLGAPQPPGHWRQFLRDVELICHEGVQRREAVEGAKRMFERFAFAAREMMDGE